MPKKMSSYEAGKIALLIWGLAAVAAIVFGAWGVVRYALGMAISPYAESIVEMTEGIQVEALQPYVKAVRSLAIAAGEANIRFHFFLGLALLVVGIVSLLVARHLLCRLGCRFKRAYLPAALQERYTSLSYSPEKRPSQDEALCAMGLLRYSERYYSANRLRGIYRNCWVSAEEIICGGVYGKRYSGRKIKVRGQWMSIQLDRQIPGTVLIAAKDSKNRYSRRTAARQLCQVKFNHPAFSQKFICLSSDPDLAITVVSRTLADKLVAMTKAYPDFWVIFHKNAMYVCLRRKSFDRHLNYLRPFNGPLLEEEALRLYGPLEDFTDMLLA